MTEGTHPPVKERYNIAQWSDGYFSVDAEGQLQLCLPERQAPATSLQSIIQSLLEKGLRLPILIRFSDILLNQVSKLYHAFEQAIHTHEYLGDYTLVYPIKSNQQRYVIETLLSHEAGVGLECGSKTELLAILGVKTKRALKIVCNGYKDSEYIRLALIASALGHEVFIIVELPTELPAILSESQRLNIVPRIGIRVRLASIAKGRWQNTGGEKSKFGLTAKQVMDCLQLLRSHNALNCLVILHCHLGSQISNIRDIQRGIQECTQYLVHLSQQGVAIEAVDLGGGLGVDYAGTQSRGDCSMNYDWPEYANNLVQLFKAACRKHSIQEPHIMTESGRAITAHHAMLVTNIIDIESPEQKDTTVASQTDPLLQHMQAARMRLTKQNAIEIYHDVAFYMEEAYQMFSHGVLDIEGRSLAETIYQSTLMDIRQLLNPSVRVHQEILEHIYDKLADKIFCNLSIFQSMPDVWAIKQIFPIVPLTQLNKPSQMRGVLHDLTCDSDGTVDQYIDSQGIEKTLPLPAFDKKNPYLLGFFMVGAYQEILGDIHNLFGDIDSVHVVLNQAGEWAVEHVAQGDNSASVLEMVNFSYQTLLQSYHERLLNSTLPAAMQDQFLLELKTALMGYTYLEE